MMLEEWYEKFKITKSNLLKQEKFKENMDNILYLHKMVHSSSVYNFNGITIFDTLLNGIDETTDRTKTSEKGRTIIYNIWHSTRIEDITMNILVNKDNQVFMSDNWKNKINSPISDTRNSLTKEEILDFTKKINFDQLIKYRNAVAMKTKEIIKRLTFEDLNKKFDSDSLNKIFDEGAVLDTEGSSWLVNYWGNRTVAGILLMPVTKHNIVHINQSFRAKRKIKELKEIGGIL